MHLQDEVLLGTLTRDELDLVCSPWGGLRATFGWGGAHGRKFVRTAARLGLSKWHTGRAMKGRKVTVSADWIVPLRQELGELRTAVARSMGRAVAMPQAWTPGAPQGPSPQGYPQQAQSPYPPQQWRGQAQYHPAQGRDPYPQPSGQPRYPHVQGQAPQPYPQTQAQQPYPQGPAQQPYPQGPAQQPYPQGPALQPYPQPQGPPQPPQEPLPQQGAPPNRYPPPGWGRR
jgi:hypothetical protein